MSFKRLMGFAVVVLLCMLAPAALADGVNRALLVGCDRFVSQEDTTPSSANNVTQMADALSGGSMNLEMLITRKNDVTTPQELEELIQAAFSEAEEGDVSYFYISTHGLWSQGQSNGSFTLLLSDGKTENGITADELRVMFDQIKGTKVLILDACHAGAVIGKGVHAPYTNVFEGDDYKVICSSGGAEESWFWSAANEKAPVVGAGYFSSALVSGLSVAGSYGADSNHDGVITLTELRRYLLGNHGASTAHTYPEEDDFPVLTYDAESFTGRRRDSFIEAVSFSGDVLSADSPLVEFSFTVLKPVQVAYQIIYQHGGSWDFEGSRLTFDDAESIGVYSGALGYLSPGLKERTLTIDLSDAGSYGYVLLQILAISDGVPSLVSSRVLCVTPASGDPLLEILPDDSFCPDTGGELNFVVHHQYPCELTVTIEDMDGNTVRRLSSRQATRPERLLPLGSTFCWNGRQTDGSLAEEGMYRIRVKAYVGSEQYEALSEPVVLLSSHG